MPPRRLVRRQPLSERVKAYLNPLDFLLWLSEELETNDWEQWQKDFAVPIGAGLNIILLIARANSQGSRTATEDLFSDEIASSGWTSWLASLTVYFLTLFSFLNAAYTFYRKRHYRLFEAPIDAPPSTPSARRVRVTSSPLSSSPFRVLSNLLVDTSAEGRAHPNAQKDVWEVSVWDPTPICLRMFCLFSPGHVLIYLLFLPTTPNDFRPSMTVVITLVLAGLLSVQMSLLENSFLQQGKDNSLIQKEVLNEYDTKYVHPRTQLLMRDVGTQHTSRGISRGEEAEEVDTYTPRIIVNRGFHTKPNANYIDHVDPEGARQLRETPPRGLSSGLLPAFQTPARPREIFSPIHPITALRQPPYQGSSGPGGGDGGSLGIYSHAHSPLKKSASTHFSGGTTERERSRSPVKRPGSPLKRMSVPGGLNSAAPTQRWTHLQNSSARRESGRF